MDSLLIPTGLQLQRHQEDLTLHQRYLEKYRAGAVTEGAISVANPFGASSIEKRREQAGVHPSNTAWNNQEKQAFFGSLARRSRWRPDLIAQDVGTKSDAQVQWYLNTLAYMSESRMAKVPGRYKQEHSVWQPGLAPAARQVDDSIVALEDHLGAQCMAREAETIDKRHQAKSMKQTHKAIHQLGSLPTYPEIKGPDSVITKSTLRMADLEERFEKAKGVLQDEQESQTEHYLSFLNDKRLKHLAAALKDQEGEQPMLDPVGTDGTISLEAHQALADIWQQDEARLNHLEAREFLGMTLEQSLELETLRKLVRSRKNDKTTVEADDTAKIERSEVENSFDSAHVQKQANEAQETSDESRKRKQRESEDDTVQQVSNRKRRKRRKNIPIASEPHEVDEPTAMSRLSDLRFTREQAHEAMKQFQAQLDAAVQAQRLDWNHQITRLDRTKTERLRQIPRSEWPQILQDSVKKLNDQHMDIFNLDKINDM